VRLTPRRAAFAVAALCLAMIALALGVTAAVDAARPGIAAPPPQAPALLSILRFDFDEHATPDTTDYAVRVARASGLSGLVNLGGGAAGAGLEAQVAAARRHGGQVLVFMNLDPEGCCGPEWAEREAARLAAGKALGARGLEVGDGLAIDALPFEPVWEASAALDLPVVVQTRDLGALARLVERHPRITFVGAHFGGAAQDPAAVERLMDRLPNLWVDTAGSVPELGRHPEETRRAIIAHPDRVLFGTGLRYVESGDERGVILAAGRPILLDPELLGGRDRSDFFVGTYAFFETRDRGILSPTPAQGKRPIDGMGLPRRALEALYHGNAERLLRRRLDEVGR
jgi:predicted TIM-barrel fold metal-dependent hydrolase